MARLLAPEGEPVLVQGGQHVAVPDLGLLHDDAPVLHGQAEPQVGHDGDTTVLPASLPRSARSRAKRASSSSPLTTPPVLDGQQPVGVAVEGQTQVGVVLDHCGGQGGGRWSHTRR